MILFLLQLGSWAQPILQFRLALFVKQFILFSYVLFLFLRLRIVCGTKCLKMLRVSLSF